jgi:nucleotide-binding universal stress UspA family protein
VLTTSVRGGHPPEEIRTEAEGWDADVVVLATHGRGGLSRAWMGSVMDHFIRTATQPVLAIRPPESGAPESAEPFATGKVVVPLDGSQLAETALPFGATLAKQFGVPLVLIRAVPLPRVPDLSYLPDEMTLSDDAASYLKEHLDRLSADGIEVREVVIADNATAHAILSQAESDLVVMSTHGRTGFDRAFFGSVADKVVRGASGPVMVIPQRE